MKERTGFPIGTLGNDRESETWIKNVTTLEHCNERTGFQLSLE
jgi:hypothetical protein